MNSKSMKRVVLAAATSVLCGLPLAAHANQVIILPGAEWSGFVSVPLGFPVTFNTTPVTGPGTIQGGSGNSFAGETSITTPQPSLSVRSGGFDAAQISGGQAHVDLRYYIEIVGPGSGLAPLNIVGNGGVGSFNGGTGAVSLNVVTPGIGYEVAATSQNGHLFTEATNGLQLLVPDGSAFQFNGTQMFPLNTPLLVEMLAIGDSDVELGPSEGHAVIDPIFSIDRSFANFDQYSIVLSPGIGNGDVGGGGGVPEPSTWAMMLLGFGALGAVARSRRRAAAAV